MPSIRSNSKIKFHNGEEHSGLSLIPVSLPHVPVDLNRLYDDVKQYSCTPRNYSVNLREELRTTNAIFFPRCLLVQRCGGNCGCGTDNWNNGCNCRAAKTTLKLHEVGLNVRSVNARNSMLSTMAWHNPWQKYWFINTSIHYVIGYGKPPRTCSD